MNIFVKSSLSPKEVVLEERLSVITIIEHLLKSTCNHQSLVYGTNIKPQTVPMLGTHVILTHITHLQNNLSSAQWPEDSFIGTSSNSKALRASSVDP